MPVYAIAPREIESTGDDTPAASLWRYVWRMSGWHQVGICLLAVVTAGLTAVPLELQRRIVNDVVAGALCVFVYETITRWYYKTSRPGRKLEFVNCFKLGLAYSLIADAFKLGS